VSATKHSLGTPRHPRVTAAADLAIALAAVVLTPVIEWFDDHVAEPTATWWADLKPAEKVAAALKVSIGVGMVVGALIALVGCGTTQSVAPSRSVEVPAVRLVADIDLCTDELADVLGVSPDGLSAALNRRHSR
jgi:hypothetical protein